MESLHQRRVPIHNLLGILNQCIDKKDIETGRALYSMVIEDNFYLTPKVCSLLIQMFSACGNISEALKVFSNHEQNVYTWSSIILAHAQHDEGHEGLRLYNSMKMSAVEPNLHTYVAVVKACPSLKSLDNVYSDITKQGLQKNHFIGNTLVNMYARLGNVAKSREVFDQLKIRDAVAWSAMITAYTNCGRGREAINLFFQMWRENPEPNEVTFLCTLKACSSVVAVEEGRVVHSEIMKWFQIGKFLGSTLIDMYAKCGFMEDAHNVFDGISDPNVVCWNALLSAYANHKYSAEVLQLFSAMQAGGLQPNETTFVSILKACAYMSSLEEGMLLHSIVMKQGLESDVYISNSMVYMYVKCSDRLSAVNVFEKQVQRNVVSWNAIIAAHVESGYSEEALDIYTRMRQQGILPGAITLLSVLKGCAKVGCFWQGQLVVNDCMEQCLNEDLSIGNALVDMFAKCGSVSCSKKIFDILPEKNVVSWSALIFGCVQNGHDIDALKLFDQMQQEGVRPDEVTLISSLKACTNTTDIIHGKLTHHCAIQESFEAAGNVCATLVVMYDKCGSIVDAFEVFSQSVIKDVVLWSAIIAGVSDLGLTEMALEMFEMMQKDGILPNEVTYASLLKGCVNIASLDHGKFIHAQITKQGLQSDTFIGNTLVDMYAKCGSVEDAQYVFRALPMRDVVSWSAIIEGYANHGFSQLAEQHLNAMQEEGIKPVDVTFVSILSAFSNAGLIEQAQFYFTSMKDHHDLMQTTEHCVCLVDVIGRTGQLCLAEDLILKMPIQSESMVWMTLLGSCARFGNIDIGKQAFCSVMEYGAKNITAIILLSNILAANQMWEDAMRFQELATRICVQPHQFI